MAHDLIVWGLDPNDWAKEKDIMIEHGDKQRFCGTQKASCKSTHFYIRCRTLSEDLQVTGSASRWSAGCIGSTIEFQAEGDVAWCAACFPVRAAAAACATTIKRASPEVDTHLTAWTSEDGLNTDELFELCAARFQHVGNGVVHTGYFDRPLQMSIDPQWQTFGKDKATAAAELIELAERLGCQHTHFDFPRHEAVSLARGAADVLAAIKLAGGVKALAAADPAAAACLCHGLMQAVCDPRRRWLPGDMRWRVEDAFAVLGPEDLGAAAAWLRVGVPGAASHACNTTHLTRAFLQKNEKLKGADEERKKRVALKFCQVDR
jgi:hypothetical protein